jgi:hypothetical protein
MNRQYLLLAGAGVLAVAVLSFAVSDSRSADDEVPIIVPKDVAKFVTDMTEKSYKGGKDDELKKDADTFFKKYKDEPSSLKKTMWVFKPREADGKGGFGVGKPGQYSPDGIEGIIITHGNPRKKPMSAKELKEAETDFIRIADVSIAMAEITHKYVPTKKEPMKDPKDWTKFTDEMKKSAQELKTAVKANKPDETKAAFTKLYSSCTNCHAVFRD